MSWPTVALGEIFDIARGGSPRPIENFMTDDADGLNWIKIGDASASGKYIERTKEKIRREGRSKSRYVEPGDLLLTNSMSFGRPYIMATDGCIHDGWLVLKPRSREHIFPDYFYYLLGSDTLYDRFASRAGGSTVKNLNSEIVSSIEVQVPPLPEQRRIAGVLDKADAMRRKRKRAIGLLDSLTQSIFLEMFGDPNINPRKLPKTQVGDLVRVKSGNGLVAKDMDENGSFPVYGGNGINGHHSAYMFEEPMIVLGRVGVYCGAVHVTRPRSWVTDNALYVSEIKRPTSLQYLADALRFADLNQYAGRAAQPLISGSRIYPVEVLLPPLELQQTYEKAIASSRITKTSLFDSSERLHSLFSSLQSRAFSGQL